MTEEQLKQGNEIATQINELKSFLSAFNDKHGQNVIEAEYVSSDKMWGDRTLELRKYPELSQMIVNYISNHIKELEKQLEEL